MSDLMNLYDYYYRMAVNSFSEWVDNKKEEKFYHEYRMYRSLAKSIERAIEAYL